MQGSDMVTALNVFNKWLEAGSQAQQNGSASNSRPSSAGSAGHADDDCVSEHGSELSSVSTTYGGRFTKQGEDAAKRWATANSVNNKTLGIARAAKTDILRLLAAANMAVDNSHETDCKAIDINKMFAAGFFQNLASRRGRETSFLAAESQQVGVIHAGSAFQEVKPDRWPHWVLFMELFRSNQVFLTSVAPFNVDWLEELGPLYHQERLHVVKVTLQQSA